MKIARRSRIQNPVRWFGTFAAVSVVGLTGPARGDVTFEPFVSARQVVSDSTDDGRGARGWLELGTGFNLDMNTHRLDGNVSYRYAHRLKEFGRVNRNNRHNGSANVRAELIDEFLVLDAGGTATQYATDPRGFNGINADADSSNQTQVFSGYVQPSIRQRIGNLATFDAHYRLGAVSADGPRAGTMPGNIGLDPTDGLGATLTDSVSQSAGVTLASTRGTNTINWALTGTATHEDIDQLNQKYRGYSGGGQLGYQVSSKLELTGSAGYEDIENTQDSILFDPVTGLPELNPDGSFRIDPLNPRRTAYDTSGVYWNVGFRYAPSRRTQLEVRVGERYGQADYYGDFSFQARSGMLVRANYSRSLNSFTRLLTQSLDGVPIGFSRIGGGIDQFGVPFCVIGIDPSSPDGECLLGLTQSVTPATFLSDRGLLSISRQKDALTWTGSLFYDKRRYVDAQQLQAPGQPELPSNLFGDDEVFGTRGHVTIRVSQSDTLNLDTMVSRNSYALSQDRKDTTVAAGAGYTRRFTERLSANASLYGSQRFSDSSSDSGNVTASVGMLYSF